MDDSVEALDAAAVEAALSLCEEAVSEGHTLPGPWETQELKPSEPPVQQEHQDVPSMLTPSSGSNQETQNQPDVKREEQFKGSGEGAEVAGSDVTSSVASDDGAAGCEVAEEGAAVKEAADAAVKSEGEDWSQTEANPPCLGGGGDTPAHSCTEIILVLSLILFILVQTQRTVLCQGRSPR